MEQEKQKEPPLVGLTNKVGADTVQRPQRNKECQNETDNALCQANPEISSDINKTNV